MKNKYINEITNIYPKLYPKYSDNISNLTISNIDLSYYITKPYHLIKYRGIIIFGITSTCDSFKTRMIIRETLKKRINIYNSYAFFFLGKSYKDKYNSLIIKEQLLFNDIVQISFYESYFNLTILTLWMMKWIINNCFFTFFIKNDQDVIPNIKLLYTYIKNITNTNCSYGIVKIKEKTCRTKKSNSYIPFHSYNKSVLPNYIFGFFAIYTFNLIAEISKISFVTYPIIYKEDVHIGYLAKIINYSFCQIKYRITQLQNYNRSKEKIKNTYIIAVHGVMSHYRYYYNLINHT